MKLSKQATDEFQQIYLEEFEVDLAPEVAEIKATELLELFRIIYKPILKEENDS